MASANFGGVDLEHKHPPEDKLPRQVLQNGHGHLLAHVSCPAVPTHIRGGRVLQRSWKCDASPRSAERLRTRVPPGVGYGLSHLQLHEFGHVTNYCDDNITAFIGFCAGQIRENSDT